jgi:PAS domain S-box-containing protein
MDYEPDILHAAVERARDAYVVSQIGPDRGVNGRRIIYVNPAFSTLSGWSAEHALGRALDELLIGPRTGPEGIAAIRAELTEGGSRSGETILHGRDGAPIDVCYEVFPIRSEGEGVLLCMTVLRDVSEKRREEAERAAEEERARRSQRMEAMGRLTGGVAHDFNNLLTVIMGNAEVLSESLDYDPELAQLADLTLGAAERGAVLTNRLLAFAQRQALEAVVIDPAVLLRDTKALLARTLREDVTLEIADRSGGLGIRADREQLGLALSNMALNSQDAMPSGGSMRLAADVVDIGDDGEDGLKPGRYIAISVVDEGDGMSGETLDRAWEPYFTTREPTRNSGLGLSMVYGFAQQSKGAFRLTSRPGLGTEATILLPAAPEAGESAAGICT